MSTALSRRSELRRVELIRRFKRQIAKASLYLASVDISADGSVLSHSREYAWDCEDVRVNQEVRRLESILVEHERAELRMAMADLTKTVDISNGPEEYMSMMDEVFEILILPGCIPPRDIFEVITGLRLIPDEEVCKCRESEAIQKEILTLLSVLG
ncbi:hypothetical protein KC19_12G161000 [Ceratodon purpureus]|uniref:Uncharacterized protein n=1 Tax=Ceratodon purpureus TaxID=3225 RepID=A0A8T0GAC8_CERPU|nr:hypothetical protein KC19_12G161000 [Ceratodon purpureus]